jgi:aminoglycoside phosphotransferase family enzyme
VLGRNAYQLPADRIRRLCDWHRSMLRICLHWLEERMHGTHIVEGHGDLRPEHVCIRERIDYLGLAERHQACASAVSEPPS